MAWPARRTISTRPTSEWNTTRRTETVEHGESQLDALPTEPAVVGPARLEEIERLENDTPHALGVQLWVDPRDRIPDNPQVPPHLGKEQVLLVLFAFERELPIVVFLVRHLFDRALEELAEEGALRVGHGRVRQACARTCALLLLLIDGKDGACECVDSDRGVVTRVDEEAEEQGKEGRCHR